MAQQNISVTVDDDRAMVVLSGEHEAYTADKLAGRFAGLLDEGVSIVVDLRTTTFVDSTVIGVLLVASRKAERHGLGFVLLVGDETGWPVQRVLEVTGLVREFDVVHG